MLERERRLRARIDVLLDARAATEAENEKLRARANRKVYRCCPYCGRPCYGTACSLHRDVARIERELSA